MIISINRKCWVGLFHLAFFSPSFLQHTFAQNIIRNPSFEKIDSNKQKECSISFELIDAVSDWEGINTVDFATSTVPFTIRSGAAKILPVSGKCMLGVYLMDMGEGSLPESFFQKLSSPLLANAVYRINFYVHFRTQDRYILDNIQIKTTKVNPCIVSRENLKGETFIIPIEAKKITETDWLHLSSVFSPKEDADFLVIGYFENKTKLNKKSGKGGEHGVYAFFDDIELVCLTPNAKTPPIFVELTSSEKEQAESKKAQEPLTVLVDKISQYDAIPSVSFDHNSFEMAPLFKKILGEMVPGLLQKGCPIRIEGHTDKTGGGIFNEQLARNRAQAVADFFISKGFPKEKIQIEVFGSSKPIALGDDDMSLGMNRRVEISQVCK